MLYVANATRQNFRFCYRLPEAQKSMVAEIPSGRQVDLDSQKKLTTENVDYLVKQLERYGARPAKEARGSLRDFNGGILYSTSAPVKSGEIEYGNEQHLDAAQDRSVIQATRSAVAADHAHRDKRTGKRKAKSVTTEVMKHGDPRKGEDEPLMSVTVAEDGDPNAKIPV